MLWSVKSERDERQGLRSTIELLRVPRAPGYHVIADLDSQPARYFFEIPCTSVAGAATSQLGSFCGS